MKKIAARTVAKGAAAYKSGIPGNLALKLTSAGKKLLKVKKAAKLTISTQFTDAKKKTYKSKSLKLSLR